MHDIVEFAGLGLGILGLIPLWTDKRKHLIATAVTVLVIVGAIFVLWERHVERLEEIAKRSRIEKIENQIVSAVCRSTDGMNFDRLILVVDREYDWQLVDEALGNVVDSNYLEIDDVLVGSWAGTGQIPLRIWKVKDRAHCKAL